MPREMPQLPLGDRRWRELCPCPCLTPQLTAIASFVDMVDLCSLLRRPSPAVAAVESVTSWSREWETQGPNDNNNILIIIRIVRMAGLEKNQLRIS